MNAAKAKLLKEMEQATVEMGRTEKYPEMYAAAKARHIAAKRKLIEMMGLVK